MHQTQVAVSGYESVHYEDVASLTRLAQRDVDDYHHQYIQNATNVCHVIRMGSIHVMYFVILWIRAPVCIAGLLGNVLSVFALW